MGDIDFRKKPRSKYRRHIGGSQPSEDQLIDEFMDSFQDARTADQALAERRAADAELIRNMPTQPNHDRYVFPTLRPPHIAERRIYNTPLIREEYIPDLEETSDLVRRYKERQDREKKGGMMQVSDDENDFLPEAIVEQVADVLQGNINTQTHDALMALLPQHGQAADRDRLRASLDHYGYGAEERAGIMNAYNNLYNAFHTPQGSDDESEMSEYSSSPGVPMVSDDEMDGAGKKKVVKVQKNKITDTFKNPNSIMEISKRMLRERDTGERDANLNTEQDKERARVLNARHHDRLKEWRRSRDIYIPQDETAATVPDGTQEGGRHVISHTVRPFFAMN